jgi:hypothetical protein
MALGVGLPLVSDKDVGLEFEDNIILNGNLRAVGLG